jgi:hypothetical protein
MNGLWRPFAQNGGKRISLNPRIYLQPKFIAVQHNLFGEFYVRDHYSHCRKKSERIEPREIGFGRGHKALRS